MFRIVLIAFLLWLGLFFVISLVGLYNDPVSFAIRLDNGNGQTNFNWGQKFILNYSLSNYWPEEIKNITVTTKILDKFGSEKVDYYVGLNSFNTISGNYTLDRLELYSGNYTIKTDLDYIDRFNHPAHKELTLGFLVK